MKIEINLDPQCKEPQLLITAAEINKEIEYIVSLFSDKHVESFIGFQEESVTLLQPQDIFRIYASQGRVYAETAEKTYRLKIRLYEAEEQLNTHEWVRISHSELINIKKAKHFDLSLNGTIGVEFINGVRTYVSRRSMPKIKALLGI